MANFCGEIMYMKYGSIPVHSDVCNHGDEAISPSTRDFIHACLDEWLDKANGTGIFYVGDIECIQKDSE